MRIEFALQEEVLAAQSLTTSGLYAQLIYREDDISSQEKIEKIKIY